MKVTVAHKFLPKKNSTRAAQVMDHFGIGFEQGEHVIARDFELPLHPGQLVLFTGESGSGKSSLMQAVASELALDSRVINLDHLSWDEKILVDLLPKGLDESLPFLTACGLGEAHLLLRTPSELSDGQRYRFRLALALAQKPKWIVADEFTATLDRRLAQVVAANVRKLASQHQIGVLLATTHEDIIDSLQADVHVSCQLDGRIQVVRIDDEGNAAAGKKKGPTFSNDSGSLPPPNPTGRISLGGIIAATTSV